MLLEAVAGLSKEQQCFQCAADRWSVANCVEHVTVVEGNILRNIQKLLQAPPPAEKPDTAGKDQMILERVPARATRVKGPAAAMPQGRWPNFDELLREFEATRDRTHAFAATTEGDLRAFAFPHPFLGPLDGYQWLLFLAAHCERHVRQMEEVKSDPGFPKHSEAAPA
jgi:DinB superfamily